MSRWSRIFGNIFLVSIPSIDGNFKINFNSSSSVLPCFHRLVTLLFNFNFSLLSAKFFPFHFIYVFSFKNNWTSWREWTNACSRHRSRKKLNSFFFKFLLLLCRLQTSSLYADREFLSMKLKFSIKNCFLWCFWNKQKWISSLCELQLHSIRPSHFFMLRLC